MIYAEQDDETLVALTLAGNQNAYEGLVIRHQRRVLASAYSVTHNRYMAEDAAQDAFVTAWMKLNVLKDSSKYGAWVCRIAVNCARKMLIRFREYLDIDLLENTGDWRNFDLAEEFGAREELIRFMLETQIPFLQERGFNKALAEEWFWLGYEYFRKGDREAGFGAYEQVLSLLNPEDCYYANTLSACRAEKLTGEKHAEVDQRRYGVNATGEEYQVIDGALCFWSQPGYWIGETHHFDMCWVTYNASRCDGYFYIPGAAVGTVYTGSDGSTLTFAGKDVRAESAMGAFEGCELWITREEEHIYRTYYKREIGIVRQEREGKKEVLVLAECRIEGGDGLLPCCQGNYWKYICSNSDSSLKAERELEVIYSDKKKTVLSCLEILDHTECREDCWKDMVVRMVNGYWEYGEDGTEKLVDVFP